MKHTVILISMTLLCLLLVAFVYADSDKDESDSNSVAPSSDLITNKVIVPYPPPSAETPEPYPVPREPTSILPLVTQQATQPQATVEPTLDPILWTLLTVKPYTDTWPLLTVEHYTDTLLFATPIDFPVLPTLISYPTLQPLIVP